MEPARKERKSYVWGRDPHDFYIEPEWCSIGLFATVGFRGHIHDPACGSGRIVKAARAFGHSASGADIVERWNEAMVVDFMAAKPHRWENIVCNPPFGLCTDRKNNRYPFVEKCLEEATDKVALLMPVKWLLGLQRSVWLASTPLWRVYFLAPRPSMPPGEQVLASEKPPNGGKEDFCWMVWSHYYHTQHNQWTGGWIRR